MPIPTRPITIPIMSEDLPSGHRADMPNTAQPAPAQATSTTTTAEPAASTTTSPKICEVKDWFEPVKTAAPTTPATSYGKGPCTPVGNTLFRSAGTGIICCEP